MESNNAFQEALLRARQLAAKISQPGIGGSMGGGQSMGGMKRPNDDDSDYSPDVKKIDLGSKLSAMKNNTPIKPMKDQLYLNGTIFNGEKVLDFMIPGNKVGFVIGKGGEMIRNLQERAGVKMVIYQETNEVGDRDKQLRISGTPDKVDHAKQLVNDLLVEKELELANRTSKNNNNNNNMGNNNNNNNNKLFPTPLNEYGSARITYFEYPVSPQLIGLVIGKGGETIRKIQADSGCKVQFDTTKVDAQGNKICQFTGTQDAVNRALDMVKEIIDTVTGGQGSIDEIRLVVPTSRTGTVIGRGGETIRQLKQQSGCNIELDKNFQSDNDEKCFIIRGTADKITYAQQLVTDKVGGHATVILNTLANNPMYAAAATAAAAATSTDGQYGYLTNQIYANQIGQSQYYWPQTSSDPKTVQDQYAMWAAYYAQYYSQANGASTAAAAASTDPQQQQQQQAAWAANASTSTAAAAAGQDNEAVYQQWIEYYKACGMTKEAEAIEQKLKEFKNAKSLQKDDNNHSHNGKSPK
uniref:Far upstream element-binding protein 1-like n=1 Tax=Dermatophagoides pteronyssinus TaxID=6956 RepID=A0A6P6XYQ8_DERPT|nr:far upstream element-binding protein 1-like [Dermatophagoides pteronyssinus]XP_027198426.1 far upstream element-binding protein 1-like [Dermatophagoides pteronyssinus]XP_027198427.1 far upstream element-binding protein 1-like [Dermatophagoides pteronyssinus]